MEHENRRQWERFLYPTQLQLTAAGHVLPAKLVDVSRQGMQVVAPVLLHVGDEVAATLPALLLLPKPAAAGALRGRVCWTAPARSEGAPQTRAGIVFELPLAEAEPRAVAEKPAGTGVIVQFSGAMPQVMARAVPTETGLQLRFALPCLREGSIITLHSQDDVAKEMRVVGARLDDGGAQVELLVEPCPETRRRRFLQYDEQAPTLRTPVVEAEAVPPAPVVHADEPALPMPRASGRRVLAFVGVGASLVAAAWIATRVEPQAPATENLSEVATQAITQAASTLPVQAPALVTAPDKRAAPARHTIAPAAVSGTPPPNDAPAEANGPDVLDSAPPAAIAEKPSETAEAPPPKAAPAPRTLAVVSPSKDTTEIFVPVTGSLAGMVTKIWTDPTAVVVEIPQGQVALKKKKYDIQKDGVIGLSVGRPGGVTQLRVYVNSILSQYNAIAAPGGITVRIKRDLQSLP